MIREAAPSDLDALVDMGMRFAGDEYRRFLCPTRDSMRLFATTVLTSPQSAIFVAVDDDSLTGMIAVTTYVQPMSGETIATEIAWWMAPESRGSSAAMRLFRQAETWGRERGAVKFQMIAPTDHVGQFYERLGFERLETHYQRSL